MLSRVSIKKKYSVIHRVLNSFTQYEDIDPFDNTLYGVKSEE